MGRTNTKDPITMATVAIVVLLVASAVSMGFRQLWREGVFSETQPVARKQSVEPEAPVVKEALRDLSGEDEGFVARVEDEMEATAAEQEAWEDADKPETAGEEAPGPAKPMKSKADWQQAQMAKGGYEGKSWEEWADLKAAYGEGKGAGAIRFERIRISDNEDVYVSPEGDEWHVTRLPDGTTTKVQVRPDGSKGEVYTGGGENSGK